MPKLIDARSAFKVGAKYDDDKTRVNPFPSKPVDLEAMKVAMKARTEADARAALVQSVGELKKAVATHDQALADIQKPDLPGRMSFDHQRNANGLITRTVVSGDLDFVLDHKRGPDGRITETIYTKRG